MDGRLRLVIPLALAPALTPVAACLPPSPACVDYVTCQHAYDQSIDTSAYQEGGSCWTTPQEAAACTEQCEVALASLRQLPELPEECGTAAEIAAATAW